MQAALLGERHQLLDDRPEILGLGERGGNLLMLDESGRHVGEHRRAMLMGAVELAASIGVSHGAS
jgi:hypothetical protein